MRLIALGDLHARKTPPINRIDNYWLSFLDKLHYVLDYARRNQIMYILQPGDFFHSAKATHEVVAGVAGMLKQFEDIEIIGVFGQHDLHFHNKLNPNVPLNVLMNAGLITLAPYHRIDNKTMVFCAGWEEDIPDPGDSCDRMYRILIAHRMVIPDGKPEWAGQDEYEEGCALLRRHDFDLIVSGDNHRSFECLEDNRILINAGSLMRSTTAQANHEPCFYVVDTSFKRAKRVPIPVQPIKKVMDFSKKEREDEIDENLMAFVEGLSLNQEADSMDDSVSLDYKAEVRKTMENSVLPSEVVQIVNEVMEAVEI